MRPNTEQRTVPAGFGCPDSPRCSVCMGHTHICSSRANDRFPPHKCAQRHAHREQEHSTQPVTRKHSRPRTHARVRGSKSPRSTVVRREPRRAHQHRKPCDKRAREVQFGATNRDRAMTLPIKSTKTAEWFRDQVGSPLMISRSCEFTVSSTVPSYLRRIFISRSYSVRIFVRIFIFRSYSAVSSAVSSYLQKIRHMFQETFFTDT
jgi:hypothetical protein